MAFFHIRQQCRIYTTLDILRNQHHGIQVLIVEDEPVNAEIASILLEDAGFLVDLALDGQMAVEKASKGVYGAILMDMHMPKMDGIEATKIIRKKDGYSKVPILAMTANAFQEDKIRCIAAGMNSFITKPVPPEELYSALLEALS